jgi:transposase InsO family protein
MRKRESSDLGQVAHLMRLVGVQRTKRRERIRAVPSAAPEVQSPNLVKHELLGNAPGLAWIVNVAHVPTRAGWTRVSFKQDGFSRWILGFSTVAMEPWRSWRLPSCRR